MYPVQCEPALPSKGREHKVHVPVIDTTLIENYTSLKAKVIILERSLSQMKSMITEYQEQEKLYKDHIDLLNSKLEMKILELETERKKIVSDSDLTELKIQLDNADKKLADVESTLSSQKNAIKVPRVANLVPTKFQSARVAKRGAT